jgi:succinate dehydrogenase / fumarate reductase flavoprotein subunit
MQGLADGYFVAPYTVGNYLGGMKLEPIATTHDAFGEAENAARERLQKLRRVRGKQPVDVLHRKLGKILWDKCGMARTEAGLKQAIADIGRLREEFWNDVFVPEGEAMNGELEKANRVADFLELGELMCRDALERRESCGGHFREEFQTEDGEAKRDDVNFCHVAAWEYQGEKAEAKRHIEPLYFENVELTTRSYK